MTSIAVAIVAACGDDPAPSVSAPDASDDDAAPSTADTGSVQERDAGLDAGPDGCVPCGGECVLLDSDPNHCGACGHLCGCGATTCTGGHCDATTLTATSGAPFDLARGGDRLFWGEDVARTLVTMPTAGGDAGVLYSGRPTIRGIALTDTKIVFGRTSFNILEIADRAAGGSSHNFTNHQENGPTGVVIDGDRAYWVNSSTGLVRTKLVVVDGTDGTTLATAQTNARRIAVDGTSLYWTTNTATGTVMQMPKAGGTPVALASNQNLPYDIEVDDTFVYWTNQGDGAISKVPKTGGNVQVLTTGRSGPLMLSVDATHAYYTTSSTVEKVPLAGGAPITLAAKQDVPAGLAIDDDCVYFVNSSADAGAIRKVEK